MKWLIFALGVALALGGAASILSGAPYMRIEFGWTEVIAGTTALSAGIVTLGLGSILHAVQRLDRRIAEAGSAMLLDGSAPIAVRTIGSGSASSAIPTDAALADSTVPSFDPDAGLEGVAAETVLLEPDGAATLPPRGRNGTDPDRHASADASFGVTGSRTWSRSEVPAHLPSLVPDADRAAPADQPGEAAHAPVEAPTVVGRYESGGASYVLFSDGTIEVETEAGTHRFGSMDELKAYIDQQDASRAG